MISDEFSKWIADTSDRRGEIIDFSKVAILNVDKAIDYSAEIGLMENEADAFAKLEFARALRESKEKYPGYAAKEREIFVRADLAHMFQFVADLAIVGRVLRDRIYNRNASR